MAWISKETLETIPELPKRVDFDDWEKDRGMVNLLSRKKGTKAWLPAGFYKQTKGGRLCVLEAHRSLKGVSQAVWLEKPNVRVKAQTLTAWAPKRKYSTLRQTLLTRHSSRIIALEYSGISGE